MEKIKFPEGKIVFSEGDHGDDAYRVVSGSVEVFIQEGDQKLLLSVLGEGDIFGEMAMIESRPRSASVRVVEETVVEVIKRDDFLAVLQKDGQQSLPLLSTIFERLRVTNDRLLSALDRLHDLEPSKPRRHHETLEIESAPFLVRVETNSEEMRKQTSLDGRVVRHFPIVFGRRGEIAGNEVVAKDQILIADRTPYRVSRKHCFLQAKPDGIYVEDTNSSLGSLVNGIRIGKGSYENRVKLSHGDNTLVLGGSDSQIKFKLRVEERT